MESHFFYGGVFFGFVPPPPPGLQRIVLAPMLPPHGRTKKFSEGVGNPKRPLIKTKKTHKDKKIGHPPPPHREKVTKRAPHGEKRGKLKAPTWRKSNRKSPHIDLVGKLFFIFRGGVSLLLHPLPPTPIAGVHAPVPF